MNHTGSVILHTKRLTLRPFRPEDAEAMFRNWASDPEVAKHTTWLAHKNAEISRQVIESWCKSYKKPNSYHWCITLGDTDEPVGSIDTVKTDEFVGWAEIGYCLSRRLWGQGIMTEALTAVLDYLFRVVGYERIVARHRLENPASGAVMKKAGMQYEGIARHATRNNRGEFCDLAVYAAIRPEWENQRKEP